LLFLEVLFATGSTAIAVFTAAILADIVDYATLKSGQDYAGSYYAVYTLALKSNIAIGAAIGLMVAGFSGFDASAVSHDDAHILGLHLAIAYIPAVSIAISLIFIALTPIGERRQTIIRRRLNNNTLRKSIDG
jgi:Na+/melibiose symporter-like transporter